MNLRVAALPVVRALTSPDIMFFSTIWLMVLVVLGTVAQKYIGLYQAQRLFFSSWLLWSGFIPLPGGLMAMGGITLALTAKLLFRSQWNVKQAGVIVTHMGALVLLYGGLLTSVNSTEGSMVLYEGDTSSYVSDYHARELAVYDATSQTKVAATPFEDLRPDQKIAIPGTAATLQLVKLCRNCDVFRRAETDTASLGDVHGKARELDIRPTKLALEDEVNKAGVQFRVRGADAGEDGLYFSMDFIDVAPRVMIGGKPYRIALEKQRTALPFSVTLTRFDRQYHPGTEVARSYRSDVVVRDGAAEWKSLIQMNEPLRYKGYTFYQASFIDDGERQATVLAVVKNAGRVFPYVSGIIMCIGLLMILLAKFPPLLRGAWKARAKKSLIIGALVLALGGGLLMPQQAQAKGMLDATDFAAMPILDQGRVKPLLSFAESNLQLIRGSTSLPDASALDWLAEILFAPEQAYDRPVFNIADTRVTDALGVGRRMPHVYSAHELGEGLASHQALLRDALGKAEAQLTPTQKELIATYNKVQIVGELARSLSLVAADFKVDTSQLATALGVPQGKALTYGDLQEKREILVKLGAHALAQRKKLSTLDQDVLELLRQMEATSHDQQGILFRVVPPQWDAQKDGALWYTLWEIPHAGQGSPDTVALIRQWRELREAYRAGDAAQSQQAARTLYDHSLQMAGNAASPLRLKLEVAYRQWNPLRISMIFYAGALLLTVLALVPLMTAVWARRFYAAALAILGGGLILHGGALLLRMLIMGRPPVTNLYASVIFVGFLVALVGFVFELRARNRVGLLVGAIAGVVLHFIGMKYDAEGDTMGMLVAVLDTNFWLSTHVVCITTGYACCLLGAVMAHVYLVMRMLNPQGTKRYTDLVKTLYGVAYLSLFFATLGTILGGIWADQSWGRFWGWDPKENGAMLICLWLLMLTHGRLAGRLGERGFVIGMALLSVVVALSWFGVNLLSVGLHSYGFTQGAVTGLGVFCAAEILFAVTSRLLIKR